MQNDGKVTVLANTVDKKPEDMTPAELIARLSATDDDQLPTENWSKAAIQILAKLLLSHEWTPCASSTAEYAQEIGISTAAVRKVYMDVLKHIMEESLKPSYLDKAIAAEQAKIRGR